MLLPGKAPRKTVLQEEKKKKGGERFAERKDLDGLIVLRKEEL